MAAWEAEERQQAAEELQQMEAEAQAAAEVRLLDCAGDRSSAVVVLVPALLTFVKQSPSHWVLPWPCTAVHADISTQML